MPDDPLVRALSDQYRSRSDVMVEILKMYFRILVLFAIGLLAFVGTLFPEEVLSTGEKKVIVKYMFLLSPYLISSWFAGYLFLYWNYRVTIAEMDCIAGHLASAVSSKGRVRSSLSHLEFLGSYGQIGFLYIPKVKTVHVVYLIIAVPVVMAYVFLSRHVVETYLSWCDWTGYVYILGLVAGPVVCLVLHFMFGRRIGTMESRLKAGT